MAELNSGREEGRRVGGERNREEEGGSIYERGVNEREGLWSEEGG